MASLRAALRILSLATGLTLAGQEEKEQGSDRPERVRAPVGEKKEEDRTTAREQKERAREKARQSRERDREVPERTRSRNDRPGRGETGR